MSFFQRKSMEHFSNKNRVLRVVSGQNQIIQTLKSSKPVHCWYILLQRKEALILLIELWRLLGWVFEAECCFRC
jgi:hypothetical protein